MSSTPDQYTVLDAASAAPTMPPISACDDDDGSPKYQVIRFHTIAPISAQNTSPSPAEPVGAAMMPAVTVAATLVPSSAPTRFITAARVSAARRLSARVDTTAGHRVGGVVEAVGEVEAQRHRDDQDQPGEQHLRIP